MTWEKNPLITTVKKTCLCLECATIPAEIMTVTLIICSVAEFPDQSVYARVSAYTGECVMIARLFGSANAKTCPVYCI